MSSQVRLWCASRLRGSNVTICVDVFHAHEYEGILVPQPDGKTERYLSSHPSFECQLFDSSELASRGLSDLVASLEDGDDDTEGAAPVVMPTTSTDEKATPNERIPPSQFDGMTDDDVRELAKSLDIFVGNSKRETLESKILSKMGGE